MPMYNLIEYSDNYSKISEHLRQYSRDEPVLNNGAAVDFNGNNTSDCINFKENNRLNGQEKHKVS